MPAFAAPLLVIIICRRSNSRTIYSASIIMEFQFCAVSRVERTGVATRLMTSLIIIFRTQSFGSRFGSFPNVEPRGCTPPLYHHAMTLRCDPKLFEKDLINQVIIVTGANSGCGLETSRQLAKQGATVILACRSPERGAAAAKDVGGNGIFLPLDLASLESIRNFSKEFLSKYDRLDALINNAGIMACPYAKTKDGFEMQIGCNHLGHFLLLQLLAPLLVKTADTTGKPSRYVALSSCAACWFSRPCHH